MNDFTMRTACKFGCGEVRGRIETLGGQDRVFCLKCGKWNYNAPRTETGRKERTLATIHQGIDPKCRARILVRSSGHCEICGEKPTQEFPMHVGHLISVKAGFNAGLTDAEINSDENLAALCSACNLGIGETVIPLRLAIGIIVTRLKNQGNGNGAEKNLF